MKNFIKYDKTGKIISTGTLPDEAFDLQELGPEEFIIEGTVDPGSYDRVDPETKKIIRGGGTPPKIEYEEARQLNYPSITEQLDMLWHAMDTGQIPKAEPFYTRIKTVKDSYPKDNSVPGNSVLIYSTE